MRDQLSTPTQQVGDWLAQFGGALERVEMPAALEMFAEECYWRDLVSFTWNIKTLEGKVEIGAMLAATLPRVKPCRWQLEGEAAANGDVTEAWFTFETAVAAWEGAR